MAFFLTLVPHFGALDLANLATLPQLDHTVRSPKMIAQAAIIFDLKIMHVILACITYAK